MAALVGFLAFIVLFLSVITEQASLTHTLSEQTANPRMVAQTAQQELSFFQACSSFLQGFGAPANGQYIQVSDLVTARLLPISFPAVTPFGQTLEGWPVLNSANASITNLFVFPSGALNTDALTAGGYGRYSSSAAVPAGVVATLNQAVYAAIQSSLPAVSATVNAQSVQSGSIAISTGTDLQLDGAAQTVLVSDTGISNSTLVGVSNSPAIESVAPNQLGYTLIEFSSYGNSIPWDVSFPVTGSGGLVTSQTLNDWTDSVSYMMHLNLMGWSPVCPAGATLLTPGMAPTQNTLAVINGTANASLSGEFCLQSYRTEGINVIRSAPLQLDKYWGVAPQSYLLQSGGDVVYSINGGAGTSSGNGSPSMLTQSTTEVEQIGINQSVGMAYTSAAGTVANPWSLPYVASGLLDLTYGHAANVINGSTYVSVAAQNNLWDHSVPIWSAVEAVNLIALQPNGTGTQVNTYQIALFGYQLPTGSGASWAQLNLPTPVATDSASGWAGWPWVSGLSIWRGFVCPATSNLDNNVLATTCTGQSALGTSNVTAAFRIQTSVSAGALSNGVTAASLSYQYNAGSGNANESFSISVPSSLVTTLQY